MRYTAVILTLAVQPVLADPGDQLDKILPSDSNDFHSFGLALSVYEDLFVAGAIGDDENGQLAGSVYLYNAQTGELQAKVTPRDAQTNDFFGASVAMNEDLLLVGAIGEDQADSNAGAAYIFDITDPMNPIGGEKLVAADAVFNLRLGFSSAIAGNLALVGAIGDPANGENAGSAYLFEAISGDQLSKLLPASGAFGDRFGASVALSGNVAAVGAPLDDDQGDDSGSVTFFDLTDPQNPTEITTLLPADGAAGDRFGEFMQVDATTLIVAAPGDDNAMGSAYLYDITNPASPSLIHKLTSPDATVGAAFGTGVSVAGSVACVGSPLTGDDGLQSGVAYLFDVPTGGLITRLIANDAKAGDFLGSAVGLNSSLAIVGAPGVDDLAPEGGAVYTFESQTSCPGDLDGDQDVDADDFFAYLDAFATGDIDVCDIDQDADCDAVDFFAYLDLFIQPCD